MYRAFSDGSDLILIMSAQPEYHTIACQHTLCEAMAHQIRSGTYPQQQGICMDLS